MKQLTIIKTSSRNRIVKSYPDNLSIELLRDYILQQPECTQVSEIRKGQEFSFEMGDEGVTYTLENI